MFSWIFLFIYLFWGVGGQVPILMDKLKKKWDLKFVWAKWRINTNNYKKKHSQILTHQPYLYSVFHKYSQLFHIL